MKNKRPFNHVWWIIPILGVLFFVIFLIFRSIKDNKLNYSDWLTFVGSYLGFAGSVILGYVAIYQNRKLRDDNEKQHKNAIRPIINFKYRKLSIIEVSKMREYFHYIKIDNDCIIEHTNLIPRDIRSLSKKDYDLYKMSSDKSISDKEYNEFESKFQKDFIKLSKKYLLIDFYLDNNGNGNAINIEILLNNKKLNISPSLQSNKYNAYLFLIELDSKLNTANLNLNLSFEDIDNGSFTKQEIICISRNINGQLTTNDK